MNRIFDEQIKRRVRAIVRTFETGKPLGDYAAFAVLADGAGVSYGISQFTHRSGSLRAVIDEYLRRGGVVGRRVIIERYALLRERSPLAYRRLASDVQFRNALRAAAVTGEMRAAQDHIAEELYLQPAIDACAGSGFVLPLSLAVIYDSLTHGSYEAIRDRVRLDRRHYASPLEFEKAWITSYVRTRDGWLASIPRLRSTRYRTRFFLDQIQAGRWELELPLVAHGVWLTPELLGGDAKAVTQDSVVTRPLSFARVGHPRPNAVPQKNVVTLNDVESRIGRAVDTFDRIDRMAMAVVTRTDRAKSLWTAVVGTLFQTAWALIGFAAGLPAEVWFFAAGVAAALTLMYLYRQITLGRLRELNILKLGEQEI